MWGEEGGEGIPSPPALHSGAPGGESQTRRGGIPPLPHSGVGQLPMGRGGRNGRAPEGWGMRSGRKGRRVMGRGSAPLATSAQQLGRAASGGEGEGCKGGEVKSKGRQGSSSRRGETVMPPQRGAQE